MQKSDGYISLKEAARISGYSPDYIGQLIRKGKLPGKQVFSHVSWMTTEEAIRLYIEKDKGQSAADADSPRPWASHLFSVEAVTRIYTAVAWVVIALLALLALFLAYVLAASLDRAIERNIGTAIEASL